MRDGKVYLVGAGPGDPGLITVKGVECIRRSDVIIYDYLASPVLLKYALPGAEKIYVGKKGSNHTLPQSEINALIAKKAKTGATVTRLKGGDPFIFARGGEEMEVLVENGVPFEIVPGVTSAIAAPAYAGIPLTHRKITSTVAFVTGHENPDKVSSSIDWLSLAKGMGTIVFLMGVKNLPTIVRRLIESGMPPHKPVAMIQWGTTPMQVTITGTLDTIVQRAAEANIKPPAVIVVGDVVGFRQSMRWFEHRPLLGKRIVITRAREQASDLTQRLADLGAECIECPTIKVEPTDDASLLDGAIENLDTYDWIVFTSANGVKYFFTRLFETDRDARSLGGTRTACIGPATAGQLLGFGLKSDIVPESFRAESVIEAFKNQDLRGKKILIPRAAEARAILPEALAKMGADVHDLPVYRTRAVEDGASLLLDRLEKKTVDMVTFTSSSTVRNFNALIPPEKFDSLMEGVAIASIGPITTETAEKLGFEVRIAPRESTIPGLCDAIVRCYHPCGPNQNSISI